MEKDCGLIEKVALLFLENGAKAVTMDDVAKDLGISKKTLYQKYTNKEALLEDVLEFGMDRVLVRMAELNASTENAIERMFLRDEVIETTSRTNDSLLLKQLLKYYPHIFNKHMLGFAEKFSKVLEHNIERGRNQGYYHRNFDAQLYANFFFQLVMAFDNSAFQDTSKITRKEFQHEALMFYMNAITTEKGKEYIRGMAHLK